MSNMKPVCFLSTILESDLVSGNALVYVYTLNLFGKEVGLSYGFWYEDVMTEFWHCEVGKITFNDDGFVDVELKWCPEFGGKDGI